MNNYRYTLEPYKGVNHSKHICPKCGKRTFVRYIDKETGAYLNEKVGRCDRELNCKYHYTPKQYFEQNIDKHTQSTYQTNSYIIVEKQTSYIDKEIYQKTLTKYDKNNFVIFLKQAFGSEVTNKLVDKYKVGTSKYWDGATVFWQVDKQGNIRTGKIMKYNPATGKRIKEPYDHVNWVHKVLKYKNYNLKQCLFGEHLLVDKEKIVAVVESEKTAIIASVFMQDLIFVATGGKQNLNFSKLIQLANRKVIFYPDLGAYDEWCNKISTFEKMFKTVKISDVLERIATEQERSQGLDLADFLLKERHKLNIIKKSK